MPISFGRLPEPTFVTDEVSKSYVNQLLRVLVNNFNNISLSLDQAGSTINISTASGNTTIDPSGNQWNGDTDGGAFTFTLPVGVQGNTYRLVNVGTSGNDLTVTPAGSELLIGVNSSFTLSDGESLQIAYDMTNGWY